MRRAARHAEIYRIGPTELRVISDVDTGKIPIVKAEEAVIRDYLQHGNWPHRQVSLFILKDLKPLARQVAPGALPPGGISSIEGRTVINLYDLANPDACHIFVNQQMMLKEGYWNDMLAVRGLLAHEHAHPLAENASTRASRSLSVDLALEEKPTEQRVRLEGLLARLVDQFCLTAPREIFTNLLAITSGFEAAMLHLNQHNVVNACKSLAGRAQLRTQLLQEAEQGQRLAGDVSQLLLAGDLESYGGLAMEVAPFDRAGQAAAASTLTDVLERDLFPQLEPQFAPTFAAIRQLYRDLPEHLSPNDLRGWSQQVADTIIAAMREQGLIIRCEVCEI